MRQKYKQALDYALISKPVELTVRSAIKWGVYIGLVSGGTLALQILGIF